MNKETFLGKVAYQVIVNVTTAVALFLLATVFKSEVQALFDTVFSREAPVVTYPIYYTAEPFDGDPARREQKIDFFIINTSGSAFSEQELRSQLSAVNLDNSRTLKLRILLTLKQPAYARHIPEHSESFNKGKGIIDVTVDNEEHEISIDIRCIEPRAILKATFLMSNLIHVSDELDRSVRSAVFLDQGYEDSCYSF